MTYGDTPSRKAHHFLERGDGRALYDINIVCVNADRTPKFAQDAGREFFDGRYTIGYWFWELEDFPAVMHQAFDHVDEVWTATEFVAEAVRKIGRGRFTRFRCRCPFRTARPAPAATAFGLPGSFLFLFMFDFFSVIERKNPIGVIRAFCAAFRAGEGPVLVIKTINGDSRLNDLERLRAAAAGRPDVLIVDEYYTAAEKNSLLGLCDCYVSLHRSEGLGLTMAEAMGLGKPVIATAYSGQSPFHDAREQLPGRLRAGAGRCRVRPVSAGKPLGGPGYRPGGRADAACRSKRRTRPRSRDARRGMTS